MLKVKQAVKALFALREDAIDKAAEHIIVQVISPRHYFQSIIIFRTL